VESPQETPSITIPEHNLKHDSHTEIVYDGQQQVKSGTLDALIEQLTTHDKPDPNFNQTFLLTFTTFTTAKILFGKLVERYSAISTVLIKV
jgi:son of sevenless